MLARGLRLTPWLRGPAVRAGRAGAARPVFSVRSLSACAPLWKDNGSTEIRITGPVTVADFARQLKVKQSAMLRKVAELEGTRVRKDHELGIDAAELIALDFGFEPIVERIAEVSKDITRRPIPEDTSAWPKRAPVVTIMGHVDHGKTTLLDSLRQSSVAAGEAGGITQHIGAFSVKLPSKETITFLDTPGHAAFSAMRGRGANVTDVVVLVVAADDGVRAQTIESIQHAREAKVPIVVAINKCDRPGINVREIKEQLLKHGLQLEDFGGDIQTVEISALKKKNLDVLEQAIVLVAELADLRGDVEGSAECVVLEARNEKGRGVVCTALVRMGTLKVGSILVAGTTMAKVRSLMTADGRQVKQAGPSEPVEISGWRDLPDIGVDALEVTSERAAREVLEWRRRQAEQEELAETGDEIQKIQDARSSEQQASGRRRMRRGRGRNVFAEEQMSNKLVEVDQYATKQAQDDDRPSLYLIVKADVTGSLEAIEDTIDELPDGEVFVDIVRSGIGPVTDGDIEYAATVGARIVGFSIPRSKTVEAKAQQAAVPISHHKVIYELLDSIRESMVDLLPMTEHHTDIGQATVRQVFKLTGKKKNTVAGCRVDSGVLQRKAKFRVLRKGQVVHEGKLSALKHVKDDVTTAGTGSDCGVSFEDFGDIQEGDTIVCFETRLQRPVLSEN